MSCLVAQSNFLCRNARPDLIRRDRFGDNSTCRDDSSVTYPNSAASHTNFGVITEREKYSSANGCKQQTQETARAPK